MKRIAVAVLALLLLTGCSAKQKNTPVSPAAAETTEAAPETTAPPRSIAERAAELQSAGDTYIYDEQNVLTAEEKQQYNDYLGWLETTRQIDAALVITDALGGVSPEAFAQSYYTTLFGTGTSGFLVLINNDTNQDYIYCSGVCEQEISDSEERIAGATSALVQGKYADALEILLPIGEQLSDRIWDRGNALTEEQAQLLRTLADEQEQRRCVLFLRNLPGETLKAPPMPTESLPETDSTAESVPEESVFSEGALETEQEETIFQEEAVATASAQDSGALQAYAEKIRTETGAAELLVLDMASGQSCIAGGEKALQTVVQEAYAAQGAYAAARCFYGSI